MSDVLCHACGRRRVYSRRACPACGTMREHLPLVPMEQARELLEELIVQHGSIRKVARLYAERHGILPGSAERILERIWCNSQPSVSYPTYDRLWVML